MLLLRVVDDVFPVAAVESMRKKKKKHKNPREQKRGSRAPVMPAERASSTRQLRLVDRTYEDDNGYLVTEKVWELEPTTSSDPGKDSLSVFGRRDRDLGTGDDGLLTLKP